MTRARRINGTLRRVARICAGMLFALLAHLTFVQAFSSRSLNADPRNERARIARFDEPRGAILSFDGTVVATSRETDGGPYRYRRFYPHGEMFAPVTGHLTAGPATGVERALEAALSGTDAKVKMQSLVRIGTEQAADVRLTISDRAQWAAYQSLRAAGTPGAAVAINPATGAVLALASYPSYDPNAFATFDSAALARVERRLNRAPGSPLLNRATAETYPAGSAFKLVTTAAALATGEYGPATELPGPARLRLPGTTRYVHNADGRPCGRDARPTLARAFQGSCDTAFAGIGLQLGQDTLRDQADAFGFNAPELTIPLPVTPSSFDGAADRSHTALAAIGGPGGRVTPLMVAMLSAAVANDGTLMRPYLVEEVRLRDGSVIRRAAPAPYRTTLVPELAGQLTAMMTTITRPGGPGTAAAIPGISVAAKSAGPGGPALFTAFAPAGAPEVAVGVVLERPGPAAPIARTIMQAVLS
ncbi:penicillin-binding transpeptidase domain-containing protein [Nonomuraea sp. NPDC049725]|uniref:peptidoglycan D,D-transpeptidase FtsI family protein n=1 Tax=Nonomuraea sp. NPDC049725 TaxID=3154508 RepID=UPI003440DD5C